MQDARITALLPVKNYQPRLLRAAIDSLFTQTADGWRLIVVVEPEDLNAVTAHLAYASQDSRVRIVPNERGRYPGAFNTGMRAAETEFVAILLGDDLWAPHAVETLQASIRAHPEVDFFHSGRRIVDDEGRPIGRVFDAPDTISLEEFVWKSPVKHLLCWRRRKALAFGGLDEALATAGPDDYDFPWTMLEHGAVFRAIHDALYVYRDHRGGFRLTTHIPRNVHLKDIRHILTKHHVAPDLIEKRLRSAKRGFLRQCLYRNGFHRWLKQLVGHNPASGWRQDYGE